MSIHLQQQITIECNHMPVVLRGDGTAFLSETSTLLVADMHLGKDASFRTSGIPVPAGMNEASLEQLTLAIDALKPKELVVLGDLIHDRNSMTESLSDLFAQWAKRHHKVEFILVRGNHDRHVATFPKAWRLQECTELERDRVTLCHEVSARNARFEIGGHLHPVVQVGRGADRMRTPCFVAEDRLLILPAFGPFKGGLLQKSKRGRKIFAMQDGVVWCADSR